MNPIIKRVGDNLFSYIKTIWSFIIQFFPRVIRSRELVWITVFLFYFGILVFDFLPSSIEVAVGQVAPEDIISPRTMEFIDAERTEQLRDQAVKEVKPVYELDTTVEFKAISDIARFFDVLGKTRVKNFAELKLSLPVRLKDDTVKKLFSLGPDEIYKLRSALIQTVRSILNKGISPQSLNIVDQLIQNEVSGMDIPQELKDLTITLARYFIRPNLSLNMEET
ncbi:MAG TPA: hypothetical protein P5310_08350, partial [bacterium]|nr:hypothetical protein [bacterium]